MDKKKFEVLREAISKHDIDLIKKKGSRVFDTDFGIFGVSSLDELFTFFTKIQLEKKREFIDLGSGDGRIVFLASLFTIAIGIEGNKELHTMATTLQEEIGKNLPEIKQKCTLLNQDYTKHDFTNCDILFVYLDHSWPKEFEEKLCREFTGSLYCYQNIFPPKLLKKGKTHWVLQTPIVSYTTACDDD